MMIELSTLIKLFVLGLFSLLVWQAIAHREFAERQVKHRLRQLNLQLLDDNVALKSVWLKKSEYGSWHFWRSYDFDFSANGHDRFKGRIVLLGKKIENILLEPYPIPKPESSDTLDTSERI